ncbi:MAG: HAMP domain-containing protein [Burkholderiales bacterium]|nr:HAMP domain-containing protein [Opitutaceae bacterium]
MKRPPRSIHRQVLVFTFFICISVLVPVGAVLFYHHIAQAKTRLGDSLSSTAQIISSNASAALAFRDESAATDILASLSNDPLIVSAALYDLQKKRFASYRSPPAQPPDLDAGDTIYATLVPVLYRGDVYGQLLVTTDNRAELQRTAVTWAVVYLGAFGLAALLAFAVAARFRRAVASPLVDLARTASDVTTRRDYTARARPGGTFEVRALAETFNSMIAEVGRRDEELARQLTALDKEIRERKTAEANLRQNHREMLRLSHAAGMAEVAAGVLHNIGNALNSINVSAELLSGHLADRITISTRALRDFFHSPPPKAAPIFSSHPDGPDVLAFAASVSDHIASHLNQANRELAALRTGVAHLKDIVARQQTLAKSSRHNETFDVREALQEALLIDKTESHLPEGGFGVETTPGAPTLVFADRSAVVQILINLLANARAAIEASPTSASHLGVRIGPSDATHLHVTVTDNGIGIAKEQLISIFNYGFTTKAGGHGFGLHNAANTARLLGGSLGVSSAGPGLGAVFTLALPLHPPSSEHEA